MMIALAHRPERITMNQSASPFANCLESPSGPTSRVKTNVTSRAYHINNSGGVSQRLKACQTSLFDDDREDA